MSKMYTKMYTNARGDLCMSKPLWLDKLERREMNAPALKLFRKTETGKLLARMAKSQHKGKRKS